MPVPTILENAVLPDWLSRDSVFYYEFYTEVFDQALSGADDRNAVWDDFRLVGDLASAMARESAFQEIINLFLIARGKAYGFRLKHPHDYLFTDETIGTGDGSEQELQLIKTYSFSGYIFSRNLYKPIDNGSLVVKYDGVAQGSGWNCDYATGLITCTPGAGVVVTASGQFHFPVRFDTDKLATQWETYAAATATLPIVEVRR